LSLPMSGMTRETFCIVRKGEKQIQILDGYWTNISVAANMLGKCICIWKTIGRVSQMVGQVSGHIMKDTGTGLIGETLQNEENCVTMWRTWLRV
jgi:hypothetical protein